MEVSSGNKPLPQGVAQEELYDGPRPGAAPQPPAAAAIVRPIRFQPMPDPPEPKQVEQNYPAILTAALDVISARLLGLLATMGAIVMFAYAVWEPIPWRTGTAVAYALVVLLPLVVVYYKRG
jgi:hypothetical protein